MGSCAFAGFLDQASGRVGCLIHPERIGQPDMRKHAFPLIATAGCNRALRCPMLDSDDIELEAGNVDASRQGWNSLRRNRRKKTTRVNALLACEAGGVLMEYVIITTLIILPLLAVGNMLFDPAGAISGDFGEFGNAFVEWYQRVMCGVALPIP